MRGFHGTAFAHPYYARFSRHSRAQMSAKHLHNERNFPQAKLDSEINARFLLNKHGNLYFSLLNNSAYDILFNLKIFIQDFRERLDEHSFTLGLPTSFPGSLILLPPGAREERPWFGLVTCVPESGTLQLNC